MPKSSAFSHEILIRTLVAFFGSYAVLVSSSFGIIPISMLLFTDEFYSAVYISSITSFIVAFSVFIWSFFRERVIFLILDIILICSVMIVIYHTFTMKI